MLKNINPLLNADVLHALASMGHGDYLVLCDTNFPALSVAKHTSLGTLLRVDADAATVTDAILSLMPLDTFIDDAAQCMAVVDAQPDTPVPEVQNEVQAVIHDHEGADFELSRVERFDFYDKAKNSFAVIACAERRFYGCFILTKGVIGPEV